MKGQYPRSGANFWKIISHITHARKYMTKMTYLTMFFGGVRKLCNNQICHYTITHYCTGPIRKQYDTCVIIPYP